MDTGMGYLLCVLPSRIGLERDIATADAERLGIHSCGDSINGSPIFKLLTREGFMITYLEAGGELRYSRTDRLHE